MTIPPAAPISQPAGFFIRAPHLVAAAIAAAATAILFLILFGALHIERRLAHLTAAEILEVKDQGISLQEGAFSDKRLLPVYGSSEFRNDTPFSGRVFFSHEPTGFEIFIIGKAGAKTLITAQRIAALGSKVRGKKVVIILSPTWFLARQEPNAAYDGNFSAIQASEVIFNSPISLHLKREFAKEMLKFPETLKGHGLLKLELERMARKRHTAEDRLIMELGRSEDRFLQMIDGCQTLFALTGDMWDHPAGLSDRRERNKSKPDWSALLADAAKFSAHFSYESSVEAGLLTHDKAALELKEKFSDTTFDTMMAGSDEWYHLELLLQTLKELGVQPLFLSIPINATSFKTQGVTAAQMDSYYSRLRKEIGGFDFPVKTFEEDENDPGFFGDSLGHPSAKGWMTFNKAISQFYHGKLPGHLD